MMRIVFTFLILLLGVASGGFGADTTALGQFDSKQPIQVSSDRLEADDALHQVRFLGDVVARQGTLVIYAQQITLAYEAGSRTVRKVEARKDVRIVHGAIVATAGEAIFYNAEGRIVLRDNPRVHQGEDFVEGDEITVLLNEDRSVVSGQEGSRVSAIFHPKGANPWVAGGAQRD